MNSHDQAVKLARDLVNKLEDFIAPRRLLVGIAGIPASGKSTFAQLVVWHVNELLENLDLPSRATLVGQDGWHFTRAQLDAFPDPQAAHDRRGAHWTFDGSTYVEFVRSLRTDAPLIFAPSFDHALKDPTLKAASIHPHHRIIVIEGLYTFLSFDPWNAASLLLDERWWIEVDEDIAKRRLVKRHVVSGVAKDDLEALWRAEENDLPNGRFISENRMEPTVIIESISDST